MGHSGVGLSWRYFACIAFRESKFGIELAVSSTSSVSPLRGNGGHCSLSCSNKHYLFWEILISLENKY